MSMSIFFNINDNLEQIIKDDLKCDAKIEKISNGWTNFVLKATTDKDVFFYRFPRNNFFSKALVKEVKFNNFIKNKTSFKTAELSIHYNLNRPFSKHKQIDGKNLYEVFDIMTETQKENLATDIVKFMYELQSIDYKDLPYIDKLSNFLEELAIISATPNTTYDFDKHSELLKLENENLVLSHGDLNPGNIIINDNMQMEAVLDFAFVSCSPMTQDLSRIIGRLPQGFYPVIVKKFEQKFACKIDKNSLDNMIKLWNYVDNNYINYMKLNCPDVIIPDNII